MGATIPLNEADRLEALHQCDVLDTPVESAFDEITSLAAELLQTPISLVSLVDESRQWFKSHHGLDIAHTTRAISFCAHAILETGVFEVQDATLDSRFKENPLVTGEPFMRFYAGVPLLTSDGHALGTLNVIDRVPRSLSEKDRRTLTVLAKQVTAQLELRRAAFRLSKEIEERKTSEAQLREAYEALIHDLSEAKRFSERVTQVLPSVLYVYDIAKRRCIFTNRAVAKALGHSADDVASDDDPIARFMHPEDQKLFEDHIRRVTLLDSGEVAELSYRMLHADGRWRWFQGCDAVLDRAQDGTVESIVGTATDVTAIKQAQAAHQASEKRLRTLSESSAVGVATADAQGRITSLNRRAVDIVGQPMEACLGRGWQASLHPDDRARVESGWATAIAHNVSVQANFRFVRPTGGEIHVVGECRPLEDTGLDGAAFVITLVDVSASRELEQHRLARAAAERANLAKSQFLAHMSHEFRTPLNAVLGFAQLLQIEGGAGGNPRTSERIGQIVRAAEWLLALINETLNLARVEAGVIEMHLRHVELASVVQSCIELVSESARQRQVTIQTNLEPSAGAVAWTDATRCKEVLINLLSNAIKYNRQGGTVAVNVIEDAEAVHISVSDTGEGIPEGKLPQLFQPFNRLGAERGDVQGTGLGLAISKKLSELMGGDLKAASTPGTGTTFTLTLPLEEGRADSVWAELPA